METLKDIGAFVLLPIIIGLVLLGLFYAAAYLGFAGWIVGGVLILFLAWVLGILILTVIIAVTDGS